MPLSAGSTDGFVARLSQETGEAMWVQRIGGPGSDSVNNVALGAGGRLLVCGKGSGNVSAGPVPAVLQGDHAGWDARFGGASERKHDRAFIYELNPTTGEPLRFMETEGSADFACEGLAADPSPPPPSSNVPGIPGGGEEEAAVEVGGEAVTSEGGFVLVGSLEGDASLDGWRLHSDPLPSNSENAEAGGGFDQPMWPPLPFHPPEGPFPLPLPGHGLDRSSRQGLVARFEPAAWLQANRPAISIEELANGSTQIVPQNPPEGGAAVIYTAGDGGDAAGMAASGGSSAGASGGPLSTMVAVGVSAAAGVGAGVTLTAAVLALGAWRQRHGTSGRGSPRGGRRRRAGGRRRRRVLAGEDEEEGLIETSAVTATAGGGGRRAGSVPSLPTPQRTVPASGWGIGIGGPRVRLSRWIRSMGVGRGGRGGPLRATGGGTRGGVGPALWMGRRVGAAKREVLDAVLEEETLEEEDLDRRTDAEGRDADLPDAAQAGLLEEAFDEDEDESSEEGENIVVLDGFPPETEISIAALGEELAAAGPGGAAED